MSLIAIVALSGRATAEPKVYSNPEFGIQLAVPNEGLLCPTIAEEHDHGFGILLRGGGSNDCHENARHRSVWLFASLMFSMTLDTCPVFSAWDVVPREAHARLAPPTCKLPAYLSPLAE
jgi:hypothetical protein